MLTETLLSAGYDVTVVDLFSKPESTLSFAAQYRNFEPLRMDVLDAERLVPVINDHDVIIPLAALVGAPICNRHRFLAEKLNFESVDIIASTIKSNQLLIYPNTNSGYGVMEDGQSLHRGKSAQSHFNLWRDQGKSGKKCDCGQWHCLQAGNGLWEQLPDADRPHGQ